MHAELWISAGVGPRARGNLHRVTWHDTPPSAPQDLPPDVIAVMLWPEPGVTCAAFYRGGWIRRCGSGTLAASAALYRWTGTVAGEIVSSGDRLPWCVLARQRFCISMTPLAVQQAQPPTVVASQVASAHRWHSAGNDTDYWLASLPHRRALAQLRLDAAAWSAATARALIAVAPGSGPGRYYLRYFAPQYGAAEDALTGSAHCQAAALWSAQAACGRQLSVPGGVVWAARVGATVELTARCHYEVPSEAAAPV